MGKVTDLSEYRAGKEGHPRDGIQIVAVSHVMIVRHYRDGILVGEEQVISERFLRDMLEEIGGIEDRRNSVPCPSPDRS
jgi:hypothetical protein